jgi:exopolysaccharide biosynthesis polyprenyl glycosylphosphotransferase
VTRFDRDETPQKPHRSALDAVSEAVSRQATQTRRQPRLLSGIERDVRGYVLRRLLVLTDAVALVLALALAVVVASAWVGRLALGLGDVVILVFGVPLWIVMARIFGLYHVDTRRVDHSASEEVGPLLLMTTLWSWLVLFGQLVGGAERLQLYELFALWAASLVTVPVVRSIVRHWARGRDWYLQNALVIGGGHEARMVLTRLQRHPEYGVRVLACVDPSGEHEGPTMLGVPVIGPQEDILDLVEALVVERVIVASTGDDLSERTRLLHALAGSGVHVDAVPRDVELLGSKSDLHQLEGLPLITLPAVRLAHSSLLLKRAMDLALALPALVVLAPVLLYCALRIKLDSPGSVFFRQERIGRDGEPFELLKFRSMATSAEDDKAAIATLNAHGGGLDSGMFKIPDDPRITRFGQRLRRHSLDEMPQLWNVVKGDMGLVGPRPLIPSEDSQVVGHFRRRLDLVPGMTGMWQVLGRSDIPFEDMVRLDYLYVTNWTLGGDFKLLLRTVGAVLRGKGAY